LAADILYTVLIDDVNVDDHVVSSGRVPHIKRDRILQPLPGSVNMRLDSTQTTVTLEEGQSVVIKEEDVIRFSGFIKTLDTNFDALTSDLEVVSSLLKLKEVKVTYGELHDLLEPGASRNKYQPSDNYGFPNVAILWLMQKMFDAAGLTLDVLEVENYIVETGGIFGTVLEKDLVLDENTLFALNQRVCGNHVLFSSTPGTGDNVFQSSTIDCLNFFQRVCIGRSYYVQPDDTKNKYKLFLRAGESLPTDNYDVADNDKYSYSELEPESDSLGGNYYEIKFGSPAVGGIVATERGLYAGIEFDPADVNTGANTITSTDHRIKGGSVIKFTSDGTLPGGVIEGDEYYVINETDNNFQISTESGGVFHTITSQGTGTHTYYAEYEIEVDDRQGTGKYKVPYWNNLRIYYHAHGTISGAIQANRKLSTSLFWGAYSNYYQIKPVPTQKITTKVLDFSKPRMLKHYLNIKAQNHSIEQVTI